MPKSVHLGFLVYRSSLLALGEGVAPTLTNELGGVASDSSNSIIVLVWFLVLLVGVARLCKLCSTSAFLFRCRLAYSFLAALP
jgi:hypothetical protein